MLKTAKNFFKRYPLQRKIYQAEGNKKTQFVIKNNNLKLVYK